MIIFLWRIIITSCIIILQTTCGTVRMSYMTLTVTRHPEDNKSKATSSLFLVKMISKPRKHNNTKTNTEPSPPQTMGGTLNNRSTIEQSP